VSDIVTRGDLPEPVRRSLDLWTGCVAGALDEREFVSLLHDAGFENGSVEPTRVYSADDAAALLDGTGLDPEIAGQLDGQFMSGFVRATKPGASVKPKATTRSCGCADDCCT
jgi:hypothetical protein